MTFQPIPADATAFPFIAHIVTTFSSPGHPLRRTVGTGTLIGPRVILTAAHNIFDPLKTARGFASELRVTLGGQSGRVFVTSTFDTTRQWVETDATSTNRALSAFDFGVVVLPEPVDAEITPLRVETMSREVLGTRMLNVAGYPATAFPAIRLVGTKSVPSNVTTSRIFYPIATVGGMSGGPVYETVDSPNSPRTRTVRGVHTAFFDRPGVINDRGSGVRITSGILSLIRTWLEQFAP